MAGTGSSEKRHLGFLEKGIATLRTPFECPNFVKRNEKEAVEEGLRKVAALLDIELNVDYGSEAKEAVMQKMKELKRHHKNARREALRSGSGKAWEDAPIHTRLDAIEQQIKCYHGRYEAGRIEASDVAGQQYKDLESDVKAELEVVREKRSRLAGMQRLWEVLSQDAGGGGQGGDAAAFVSPLVEGEARDELVAELERTNELLAKIKDLVQASKKGSGKNASTPASSKRAKKRARK